MSIGERFQANIEALPNILQRKYSLLRDMDRSLQEIQRQNEQRCEQEIDDMKRGIKSGNITPNSSLLKFSDEALDEQKHAMRIADEKVALAIQAYDLVDIHIQQLDQYLKKLDEEKRARDTMAAVGSPPTRGNNVKSGRSRETSNRGRKKTRLSTGNTAASACASATAAAATTAATSLTNVELDLPIDPNEPTYCFCNQVSYGDMVACDNPDCKIEWFHYGCVGLREPPKGKWFCSECIGSRRRRKTR